MRYLPAVFTILASPAAAHDGPGIHAHVGDLLIPAVVVISSLASVAIAVRRLARSRT